MAKSRKRKQPRSRFALRWLGVGAVVLVALLYARPLRSYLDAKHQLARRAGELQSLKSQKRQLQRRLAQSTTPEALAREARSLGLLRPGERLFIVKGISRWLHGKATLTTGG